MSFPVQGGTFVASALFYPPQRSAGWVRVVPWLSRPALCGAASSGDVEHNVADGVTSLNNVVGFGDALQR